MSAKFCVNCGVGLGQADKFCAICGTKVVANCPTCGQIWNGVVASETINNTPPPAQSEVTPPSEVTINESFVGSKPIYGPDFNEDKDCANCGNAGKIKSCDMCGSGSQS